MSSSRTRKRASKAPVKRIDRLVLWLEENAADGPFTTKHIAEHSGLYDSSHGAYLSAQKELQSLTNSRGLVQQFYSNPTAWATKTKPLPVETYNKGYPARKLTMEQALAFRPLADAYFTTLIGIDGHGASGKTTFATALANRIGGAVVVHTDDFYKHRADLTKNAPEGTLANYDIDRLVEQVITPARNGQAVRYQKYNWDTDQLDEWVEIPAKTTLIIEGLCVLAYQLRKSLYRTFVVECPQDIRIERGVARDGEPMRRQWTDHWIPAENRYFKNHPPARFADFIVDGQETIME